MKTNKFFSALLLTAAAGGMLCACGEQDELTGSVKQVTEPDALSFSAYVNRSTTRGGETGEQTLATLQSGEGFGVFGFYTDNVLYGQDVQPNFMYNEHIEYNGSEWAYAPLKFWPNEYGTNAASGDIDRLTFFAYAPYVEVKPVNGLLSDSYDDSDAALSTTTGITRLSRSTDKGDPQVHYVATFNPAEGVDLMWGVVPDAYAFIAVDGTDQQPTAGVPFTNLYKPATGQAVKFMFNHALAALNVQIDATVDDGDDIPAGSKIYVRSVTFEGFGTEGTLNLNNTKANSPLWMNYAGNATLPVGSVTIHDQRRDGREAVSEDSNELPGGLNPAIVQKDGLTTQAGVTTSAQNLFCGAALTDPVYVIPNGAPMKVTIVYDVETKDDKILSTYLADGQTHGSVVENAISKTIDLGTTNCMEAGKRYVLKLHLGMTTVQFDADVVDWEEAGTYEVVENAAQVRKAIASAKEGEHVEIPIDANTLAELGYNIDTTDGVAATFSFVINDVPAGVPSISVTSYNDQQVEVEGVSVSQVVLTSSDRPVSPARQLHTRADAESSNCAFVLCEAAAVNEILIKENAKVDLYLSGNVGGITKESNVTANVYRLLTNQESADNLANDNTSGYEAIYVLNDTEGTLDLQNAPLTKPFYIEAKASLKNVDVTVDLDAVGGFNVEQGSLTLANSSVVSTAANPRGILLEDNVTVTVTDSKVNVGQGSGGNYPRGIQLMGEGATLNLKNSEVYAGHYAINLIGTANNNVVNVEEGTIASGWAVLNIWGSNNTFNLKNCTCNSLNDKAYNEKGWNNFGAFVFNNPKNGGVKAVDNNSITITDCELNVEATTGNKQWLLSLGGQKNGFYLRGNTVVTGKNTNINSPFALIQADATYDIDVDDTVEFHWNEDAESASARATKGMTRQAAVSEAVVASASGSAK